MKWLLRSKRVAGGFGLSVLLLAMISLLSHRNAIQLAESVGEVKQTYEVLEALTDILASLNEAESGLRGYTFLNDEAELARYELALEAIAPRVDVLRRLVADNHSQQQRLSALESLLDQKQALFAQSIALYERGSSPLAAQGLLVAAGDRKRSEIRQIVAEMESDEEEALEVWVKQSQLNIRHRTLIEFLGTALSFACLTSVYTLLSLQMFKRQQAETLQHTLMQEKELSELKLNFFSMVSHEFRTPLSIIMGSAQLLGETLQQQVSKEKLKNLYRIQSSARLMTQLLTDILTLARAEAGKLESNLEWLEMQSFCLNLVEDIQLSGESHHSIKFVQQGQCTHARVDERLLYSILSNLLSNAIKYSPQGGEINLSLTCEPDVLTFQVRDQGIGIPPENQVSLYEPFHRGKNAVGIVGTGLGLAVVKKCLDLHQGEITVESEVGVGTTFTITIPQTTLPITNREIQRAFP